MLLGGVLLLQTTGYLPLLGRFWPVFLLFAGLSMLYAVLVRRANAYYLLSGTVFSLAGLFFLLTNTLLAGVSFSRLWPVLMAIIGLSILPYGFTRTGGSRIALIVPGVTITLLALLFLPFSLGITGIGFRAFVQTWWPVLFLIIGTVFILLYFRKSHL
jgi:hypothetical protein